MPIFTRFERPFFSTTRSIAPPLAGLLSCSCILTTLIHWHSGYAGRTCPIPDIYCPPAHIAPVLGKRHRRERKQAGEGEPQGECEILELGHD